MDNFTGPMFLLFLSLLDVVSAEVCHEIYRYRDTARVRTFHCSFGCCGPEYDQYCCVSHAGVIVGIVFACIFGLAFICTIVCCCIKRHKTRGRIVEPTVVDATGAPGATNQTNVFIVPNGPAPPAYSSTVYNPYYRGPEGLSGTQETPGGTAFPACPPAYDALSALPPAYSSPVPPPGYGDVIGGSKNGGK